VVNWPTALPNKKGADRKQRPPLAIDHLIDCLQKREMNRKGGPRCGESADCSAKQKGSRQETKAVTCNQSFNRLLTKKEK